MTILVGYSPRPESDAALEAAIELARSDGRKLLVLNSTNGEGYVDPTYAKQQDLQRVRSLLTRAEVDHEVRQVLDPHGAAQALLDTAQDEQASLIVIGVRCRTAVGKLVMGSVAQTVILQSECPVLTIKSHPETR